MSHFHLRLLAAWALVTLPALHVVAAAPAPSSPPVTGPKVGEPAPAFTLRTLAGTTVSLERYRGRTVIVNAWATWCPPCRQEMPGYIAAAPKLARSGVAILGVDTTEREPVVRAYAVSKAVPYALAVTTDDAFAKAYDVAFFPTTFVIDPQGILRARIVDVVTAAQLTSFVRSARAGQDVVIASALQRHIDAKLRASSDTLHGDAAHVEANAHRALAAIAAVETMLDDADANVGETADFVRTRAAEAALCDRAIAALGDVRSALKDPSLPLRLRAAAAMDREAWQAAAQRYRAVLALVPNDADALGGLSSASYELHDYAAASEAQSKLVALAPTDVGGLVGLALARAKAGETSAANATFERALGVAGRRLAAQPRDALARRMLAYAHLYAGRNAARNGDRVAARAHFAAVTRLAERLPANDARHDMYLEEAQEATVALELGQPNGFTVSLAPWTGADLPGSIASTYKYRLAVAGDAGRNVSLVASGLPKHWIASFCNDNACAPFKTSFALPASGVKVVEFQLVPPGTAAALPKIRVTGNDGRRRSSAST